MIIITRAKIAHKWIKININDLESNQFCLVHIYRYSQFRIQLTTCRQVITNNYTRIFPGHWSANKTIYSPWSIIISFNSLVSRNKKDANTGLWESFKEGSLIDVADFAISFNIPTTKEGIARHDGFQTNSAHVRHCKNFMISL